jgi:hypothetical protein
MRKETSCMYVHRATKQEKIAEENRQNSRRCLAGPFWIASDALGRRQVVTDASGVK